MIFDSAPADPEIHGDIFAALTCEHQIHDLVLPRGKDVQTGGGRLAELGSFTGVSQKSVKGFAWLGRCVQKIGNADDRQIHLNRCVAGPDQHVKAGKSTAPYPLKIIKCLITVAMAISRNSSLGLITTELVG